MDSKKCFKCNIEWPLHYFYKHPQMADGHLNKCKKCTKSDVRKHRADNIEEVREYDKNRYQTENRKKQSTENCKKQRAKYPEKYKARTAVSNAVRDKRLLKLPCCVCGSKKSTAHHEDYNKPLEVVWVCLQHHHELEKK